MRWSPTAGAFVLTGSPLVGGGTAVLSLIMVAYSVAGAQTIIAAGRKRLNLDAEARKALTFVDEFENSGRGWFWETNPEGTLSYVSQQLADDFQCEPQALLGRPVHRLAVGRHAARSARSTRSARRSASICRRASPFPTWSSARRATRTSTGRCRATRCSTSAGASSASAASAPTSPSSAARSRKSRASRGSIR